MPVEQKKEQYRADYLADLLQGELYGDETLIINGVSSIEGTESNTITFLRDNRFLKDWDKTLSRAVLIDQSLELHNYGSATLIKVIDIQEALVKISELFGLQEAAFSGIHDTCLIGTEVQLGEGVSIGAYVVIDDGAVVGAGSVIEHHAHIGAGVKLGEKVHVESGVKITHATIGDHCVIKSNTVIGGEGFGFARTSSGGFKSIQHVGGVVIGDEVHIGSSCCIDRGSIGDTVIEKGVRLDNLIQVAHGVKIGAHTVIAAQTGISGSTIIGKNALIGGQVGIIGHISIADGSQIQAQSGVAGSIKTKNKKWYGYPSIPYIQYLRSFAIFKRLPELLDRIKRLEEK